MSSLKAWCVVAGLAVAGVLVGANVVGAQGTEEPAPDEVPEQFQAFVDCAAAEGIALPDLRAHRRDHEPLSEDERAAVRQAREACGDQLPHAEDRQAIRSCVADALAEDDTAQIRSLARTCAEDLGIDLPQRHRRCGRPH